MTIKDDEAMARRLQQQEQDAQMARDLTYGKDDIKPVASQAQALAFMEVPVNRSLSAGTNSQATPVVVVQGRAISNPHLAPPNPPAATDLNTSYPTATTPVWQPDAPHPTRQSKCQDAMFGPLFYIDIAAIVVVAAIFGKDALENSTNPFSDQYDGYIKASAIAIVVGLLFSSAGLKVMMLIPKIMIKAALIFSVVVAGVVAFFAFASGSIFFGIMALFFFGFTCCYAYCVWSRIPFATVNLVTGISSIKANFGITVFAYVFVVIAAGWSLLWAVAMLGTFDKAYGCDGQQQCTIAGTGWFVLFLLLVCYFFVHQVLQNTIHVSIAGIVATWWIVPEEGDSCCSQAVTDSLKRSLTTSFGSICFGSLLVAIIQALRAVANAARSQDDGILICLAECILACLEGLLEYFNKWAFIYVGIYGMSYCESGKQVITLFTNRGWEAIIADDLVGNVLALVSILTGALTGIVSILVELASGWFQEDAPGDPHLVAFLVGFIVGLVLCSILMSTIGSSVNAVIVLFAEKPQEFQTNHPELSQKMREKWSEIYPGSV